MRSTLTTALTGALILARAGAALAQPSTCSVTFVRAPDDVRHVIERWLDAEPHCVASIELRVLVTEDGLYLIAQRPDGRIHERMVPDAQSAAVIVASWVADDWTIAPPAPIAPPPPPPAPLPVVARTSDGAAVVTARVDVPSRGDDHWLSIGPMTRAQDGGGRGIRAELELVRLGSFVGGVAASASASHMAARSPYGTGGIDANDYQLLATLARPINGERWSVRPSIGLGAVHSSVTGFVVDGPPSGYVMDEGTTEDFVGEASVVVSRRIGDRWAISAGPIVTWINETIVSNTGGPEMRRDMLDLMLYAGVGYKL